MAIASGVWVTVWSGRNAGLLSAQMHEYSHTQHTSIDVRSFRLIINNITPHYEKQGAFNSLDVRVLYWYCGNYVQQLLFSHGATDPEDSW